MKTLAFILECAAVAAFTSAAASLAVWAVARPLSFLTARWAAARRADLHLLLALAPGVLSLAVTAAAAAPSLLSAMGWAQDHCPTHQHHVHLCLVHSSGLRPALAMVGAGALALFLFRAFELVSRLLATARQLRALERLGTSHPGAFPVVAVPCGPELCHAVGLTRRRVLLSTELRDSLKNEELSAALAHEEAHLRRRDPVTLLWFSLASLWLLPGLASRLRTRVVEAIEEACDAEAAQALRNPLLVAASLVKVASVQLRQSAALAGAAFGETALEKRVQALVGETAPAVASPRAAVVLLFGAFTALWLVAAQSHHLHHAIETALDRFF
jgi:Zn-dependent protease with chaperone function